MVAPNCFGVVPVIAHRLGRGVAFKDRVECGVSSAAPSPPASAAAAVGTRQRLDGPEVPVALICLGSAHARRRAGRVGAASACSGELLDFLAKSALLRKTRVRRRATASRGRALGRESAARAPT